MKKEIGRREMVKSSVIAGAALAAPLILPKRVFGANDQLIMGIIGPGGQGRGLMGIHQKAGAKFVAVCDVSEQNLQKGLEIAKRDNEGKVDDYLDYRELLERKDLDAVIIATPEHQHCTQMIDAVQAGLDVYCEKPMSHSIEEGARTIREVRKTDRIVQIGMQRRSSPLLFKARDAVRSGMLGQVTMVKAEWNWNCAGPTNNEPLGYNLDWERFMWPAKRVKFEPMKVRNWRGFWAFSGGFNCDQGTHIMDVVQWFMGTGTPREAECFGKVFNMTGVETPEVFTSIYYYDGYIASWTLNYNSTYMDWWHILFQGTKGTMHVDRFGFQVYQEPIDPVPKNPVLAEVGELEITPHVENFIECVKTRKEPNAPVEVGHTAVCGPHLANVAWHKRRRAKLNPEATKVTT
ncbi:MAG TPA: Gfo/Idh/MocA family oxidoreductase [bacterium]|nr:Gfo/Idh/MocA family oxidoreductase [bacterium]HQL64148.1 Gfo/Idh/MocA family oxidoreductase [bacterium]